MREMQEKCSTQIILKSHAAKNTSKSLRNKIIVGYARFELVAFSMSTKVKMSNINGLNVH